MLFKVGEHNDPDRTEYLDLNIWRMEMLLNFGKELPTFSYHNTHSQANQYTD